MSEKLWCVHISGPDDVLATPNYLTAVKAANEINGWWEGRVATRFDEGLDPTPWAAPEPWPHSPESHAADLADPSDEYGDVIARNAA